MWYMVYGIEYAVYSGKGPFKGKYRVPLNGLGVI